MIKGLLQKFRKPKGRTQAQRMLTLRSAPVYYLPITKSGSTYLKNLFYYLDHADEHVSGIDIHSNGDDLVRARTGDTLIRFMVTDRTTSRIFARIWPTKLGWI
ncbi:MAG: hypothetical protein ACTSRN_09210 [Alphaproteobacteria bacterium]